MIFGGMELARRVERAERGLIEECIESQRAAGSEALLVPIAGGLAACSGADSPLTKVVGLGFEGTPTDEELARVEAEFASRGAAVQVELCTLAEGGLAERLTSRGYALVGFENVLGRRLAPQDRWSGRAGITVDRSGDAELECWVDVVVGAFAAPDAQGVASHEEFPRDAIERAVRGTASARGLVRYLARRAGEPAGGASSRIADGIAQMCGAGTLPAHRRRGVQTALLERLLAEAARAGCDLAVVTTLPGSKSQENVQRQGFELLYVRAILRRGLP